MNSTLSYKNNVKRFSLIVILFLMLTGCKPPNATDGFYLLKHRFNEISNLSLDTIYLVKDTVYIMYTDHSGYYDPYSVDEQFLYLVMLNEDYLKDRYIDYSITLEGNSEKEPSAIKGNCSYDQIIQTSAYKAYTSSSFYRQVLQRLYRSKYYPYHFLILNWSYGYELSFVKDPGRYYNANSTELIRNFIVNKGVRNPEIDSIWFNVFNKEMKIKSINPEFDKEKKELLISITEYRSEAKL